MSDTTIPANTRVRYTDGHTDDAVDMFGTPVAANASDGEEEHFGPFLAGTPTA